jgi:hypothetical protein
MEDIVARVITDPRYGRNIEYGEPRSGHPEGKVKYHFAELEEKLEKFATHISEEHYWKLKFLIHVHDTFMADAIPDSSIASPNSHASLVRAFASEFTNDSDLLNMIQFHDVNYALWKDYAATGSYDLEQLSRLLEQIVDWDLFLLFLIIDGGTKGKEPEKLYWFFAEVRKHKTTFVDESWISYSST